MSLHKVPGVVGLTWQGGSLPRPLSWACGRHLPRVLSGYVLSSSRDDTCPAGSGHAMALFYLDHLILKTLSPHTATS